MGESLEDFGISPEDVLGEGTYKNYLYDKSLGKPISLEDFVNPAKVLGEGTYKNYLYANGGKNYNARESASVTPVLDTTPILEPPSLPSLEKSSFNLPDFTQSEDESTAENVGVPLLRNWSPNRFELPSFTSAGSGNSDLLETVRNTHASTSDRVETLEQLIRNGAEDELSEIVNDRERYDEWRRRALGALCDFGRHSRRAADLLYDLVNNRERYDDWRHQALRALIAGGHTELLTRIADNRDRYDNWREEARRAIEGD
jgi:hypothetical protein